MSTMRDLRDKIMKASKGTHISILSESDIASNKELITTPAYDLNRILSGSIYGGLLSKTLSLFIGPEASGKSSLMCLCLVEAQKKGFTPVIIDTEGAWDKNFVMRWGLDPDKILYIYTPWVDQVCVTLANIIDTGDKKLALVVDSIGGLEKKKLLSDSLGGDVKADQGTLQKEIKRMLKLLLNICKAQDSLAMISGHYYGNPTGYGEADLVGGGKFAKLAPDIIVSLKNMKKWENPNAKGVARGKVMGNTISAITLKNRYYPPFNEALIDIDYINGINKNAGMLELAKNAEIVQLAGSWYSWHEERMGQGATKALAFIENSGDELLKEIDEWLKETGYSTINENVMAAVAASSETIDVPEVLDIKKTKKK